MVEIDDGIARENVERLVDAQFLNPDIAGVAAIELTDPARIAGQEAPAEHRESAVALGPSNLEPENANVPSSHVESPAVRERIRDEFYRLAQGTGLARSNELIRELKSRRIAQVGDSQMHPILTRIDDLVELPNGLIASIGDKNKSGLTRCLRKILSVYPRLPLSLAAAQLSAKRSAYVTLNDGLLAAFVDAHPDFVLDGDRIVPRPGLVINVRQELARDERLIHEAIRDAKKPLSPHQIERHTRHHAKLTPTRLKTELRESCVIADMGDGTYDALTPSERIKSWVLSHSPRH